jgi:hypothetical protein
LDNNVQSDENPAVLIPLTNVEDDTGIPKTPMQRKPVWKLCNVVVHYAFSNGYLFWGSKGVIGELKTLKSVSNNAFSQTCIMSTMCKLIFFRN